jgi:hypothetical protein
VTPADISPAVVDAGVDALFKDARFAWRKQPVIAARARRDMTRALIAAFRTFQRERAEDMPQ